MSSLAGTPLLDNRTAVVTGAARGIGLSIATRMAAHGARVALIDLDGAATHAAARTITDTTAGQAIGVAADVTDPTQLAAAAEQIIDHFGVVDIVVPNAGILVLRPALDMSAEDFTTVVNVNLTGAFLTATEFGRRMGSSVADGRIIFTSSLFGLRGGAGNAAYSASKFGLIGLAQSMAAELAPSGIRVNCVCPGQIQSAMIDQLFIDRAKANVTDPSTERSAFIRRIPLGSLGDPNDVADTYVYLASPLSKYVTGQHIVVDGGWSIGPA